jgi:lipoprotein-anchoring transpeptidase ErfK/SrfK
MTKNKTSIRIAVVLTLALAVLLTGVYVPAVQGGHGVGSAGAGAFVAYADETTTAAIDISTAQVAPIEDQPYTGNKKKPSPKVTIDGKALKKNRDFKVEYKNNKLPGTVTVIITGKGPGYTGELQTTFNIVVNAPKSFKLKTTSDAMLASWKKPSGKITGYQVRYAEDAGFTKSKKTKTITSKKTTSYGIDRPYYARSYYVMVRTYVEVGGKKYYSDFTDVKSKETNAAGWFKKIADSVDGGTKWIEVDLSKQVVYLHKGTTIVKTYAASTGRPGKATETIRGTFRLYKKIKLHDMVGIDPKTGEETYRTPDVPWASYFKANYAFHGASWNGQVNIPVDEKRTPRSHGCVNMRVKDAKYLYNWAPIGTLVTVHK